MAMKKGPGPTERLDPKVVRTLLDRLSTDDAFRDLFQRDAHAALVEAGWTAPASAAKSMTTTDAAAMSGGSCLQLAAGTQLASKEQIQRERTKLEQSLNAIVNYAVPKALQAD
ncbi:NHLP-related RiPP peptide [Lysobacter sp. KIS68-7]|uniref:NHLP-related RiPP peptide n=1 Tax=Lysobacter sp. KIS68-7 TaxID=2904252 RepID=UPI001E57E9BE|nr:NHLP-related RiPP peptide [Lysobacter sp. KIS68-7]UHQ20564.1 NHLP-related RiPP peptide [Lysobacter sp. KIS68-7]